MRIFNEVWCPSSIPSKILTQVINITKNKWNPIKTIQVIFPTPNTHDRAPRFIKKSVKKFGNKANLRDLTATTGLVILLKLDSNHRFFSLCDLEIWWMTPKNNRTPLLCYFKLFASFRSHWWIQTRVTVRTRLIWVKIDDFFSRVTLKFDGRPSKTIRHLFYAISSFVQHFVAIGEFKLELQSGNAKFGWKSTIFLAVCPWNLMDDLEQGKSEGFESCDRPIVRKGPIWVKIGDVLYRVTLKFDGWPWKIIGHLSFAVSSFVQHFIAIGEFKLELQYGNTQFGSNSTIFRAVWPWNFTYDLEKQ